MNSNMVESLDYTIKSSLNLLKKKSIIENSLIDLTSDLERTCQCITEVKECKEYYNKAVELIYEESINALKTTVDTALQYIIYDKNYGIHLELEDKRGKKALTLALRDLDSGETINIKNSVGHGVSTVVSFV